MRLDQRILVVDDDDAIRALLRTVLRRRGFRVDAARNGIEALEQMGACRYALVILDLMMPLMSGYQLLDFISRQPLVTRPRVLVLTAGLESRPFDGDVVVGMMHKPFDIELLVDSVAGYLNALPESEEVPLAAEPAVTPLSQPN